MHDGSQMDAHIICDLTFVHLFKCVFNLGPRAVHMLWLRANLIRHCYRVVASYFVSLLLINSPSDMYLLVKTLQR